MVSQLQGLFLILSLKLHLKMNYRITFINFIIIIFAILLLSGCARKVRTPVVQPQREYRTVRPGPSAESGTQQEIPKRVIVTQPTIIPDPVQPDSLREEKHPLSINFVNRRLDDYNKKLDKWKEYDSQSSVLNMDQQATEKMVDCFRELQKIYNGYSRLSGILTIDKESSMMRTMGVEEIQALQENDILFLEGYCGKLLDNGKQLTPFGTAGFEKDLSQLEDLISQSFQNGEYEQVVQLWLEVPEGKENNVTIHTKLMYGKSLMFLHQEQKAASVYEQIIVDIGIKEKETTDILELHKVLSNLYIAARNYSAAADQYRKILDKYQEVLQMKEWSELQQSILKNSKMGGRELNEYSAIVRNSMGYIPSQDGYKPIWQAELFLENYPESLTLTNVHLIKSRLFARAELWFKKLISDVEESQLQEQYKDGLILLETIPQDILGPEQLQLVQKKIDDLRGAEEIVRENLRLEKEKELEGRWSQISALIENTRYDEAIDLLKLMQHTDYSGKVSAKIAEVSLLAAKMDRQQAARLFIRATKASEPETKKQFLVESHQLLMKIVLKYPDTRIVDKVMNNLKRVEMEMNKVDPTLVEWSKMSVQQEMMLESSQNQESTEMEKVTPLMPMEKNRKFEVLDKPKY